MDKISQGVTQTMVHGKTIHPPVAKLLQYVPKLWKLAGSRQVIAKISTLTFRLNTSTLYFTKWGG